MNSIRNDPQKTPEFLLDNDDVFFFYEYSLRKSEKDIENRKSISALAKTLNLSFEIEFLGKGKYKKRPFDDKIYVFDDAKAKNKSFFKHIRNAFCHKHIEIKDGRCFFYDWQRYEDGISKDYADKRVTMIGCVDYEALKTLFEEFFSPNQKINLKK